MSRTKTKIRLMLCILTLCFATPGCNQAQTAADPIAESESVSADTSEDKLPQSITTNSNDWTIETKIGEIVAERPDAARVLELVGIDYCCGGQIPLHEAAKAQNVDPNQLLSALSVVGVPLETSPNQDWNTSTLPDLMNHIVTAHHGWLRRELPPLIETTKTVHRVHGESHSELAEVVSTLEKINNSVLPHLDEEEQTVFPALRKLVAGEPPTDIATQLDSLRSDHDELGTELHRLRELTDGFKVPADACAKYREMLSGLLALERDMLQHVHLENNILLPRAQSMLAERKNK